MKLDSLLMLSGIYPRYGMLDPTNKDKDDLPLTIRAVFIIGPDKKLKLSLNYPASVGRNMDEIVRCVDALQLSAKHSVVSVPTAVASSSLLQYLLYVWQAFQSYEKHCMVHIVKSVWQEPYSKRCKFGAHQKIHLLPDL